MQISLFLLFEERPKESRRMLPHRNGTACSSSPSDAEGTIDWRAAVLVFYINLRALRGEHLHDLVRRLRGEVHRRLTVVVDGIHVYAAIKQYAHPVGHLGLSSVVFGEYSL